MHWPANGEIDIAEGLSKLTCSYHAPTGTVSPACMPTPITASATAGMCTAPIEPRQTYTYAGTAISKRRSQQRTPKAPQAIRFDIGVHAGAPNSVFRSAGDMLVNWVRGWTNG